MVTSSWSQPLLVDVQWHLEGLSMIWNPVFILAIPNCAWLVSYYLIINMMFVVFMAKMAGGTSCSQGTWVAKWGIYGKPGYLMMFFGWLRFLGYECQNQDINKKPWNPTGSRVDGIQYIMYIYIYYGVFNAIPWAKMGTLPANFWGLVVSSIMDL